MSSRMSLFRGEPAHVWVRRLEQRGWPQATAVQMARFLTERGTPPPAWQDLTVRLDATPPQVPLQRRKSG
jgi:hypothetical protein